MDTFFEQKICHSNNNYSVIVEDDGRVCYAYLMEGTSIVGDVWLYNTIDTPDRVDWSSKEDMPFLNPRPYVDSSKTIQPINSSMDLSITWIMNKKEVKEANIYIRRTLVAKLEIGYKPGWSTFVIMDGPLAKALR
ncbi:MAG: hypothetical protein QM762_13220 [Chryseolinea sp.]